MEYELIYHSHAASKICSKELAKIFEEAKSYNSENSLTSCLLFHNNEFLQIIEGRKADIEVAFERILEDVRHNDVFLVNMQPISRRMFESPIVLDVVGTDEFRMIGSSDFELAGFKTQPELAQRMFMHVSNMARSQIRDVHNNPVGPMVC